MKTTPIMIMLAIIMSSMATAHHYAPTTSPQYMGSEITQGRYVQYTDDTTTNTYAPRWTRGPTNAGKAHLSVLCNGWKTCPWTIDDLGRIRNILTPNRNAKVGIV